MLPCRELERSGFPTDEGAMNLTTRTPDRRPQRITRRRLLQAGGIGILGLGLPELLQASGGSAARGRAGAERSCIFIVQYGGASHHDSLDLKPEAPAEIRGPYRPI